MSSNSALVTTASENNTVDVAISSVPTATSLSMACELPASSVLAPTTTTTTTTTANGGSGNASLANKSGGSSNSDAPAAVVATPSPYFGTLRSVQAYLAKNAPRGADDMARFRDGEGRTALHWALALKNFSLAKALLESEWYRSSSSSSSVATTSSSTKHNNNNNNNNNNNVDDVDDDDDDDAMRGVGAPNNVSAGGFFCAPWALPPDVSGTSVLATASAVSAPVELVQALIEEATGGMKPNVSSTSSANKLSGSLTENKSATTNNNDGGVVHPLIEIGDVSGNTPLLLAASRGNQELMVLFLSYGADPRTQNKRGQSALHRLVAKGDMAKIEFLIHYGRKVFPMEVKKFVNLQDSNGDTALHYASMEENREVGELLLRNGARREVKNKQGKEYWQL